MVVTTLVFLEFTHCCYTSRIPRRSTWLLHLWYSSKVNMFITPLACIEDLYGCYNTRIPRGPTMLLHHCYFWSVYTIFTLLVFPRAYMVLHHRCSPIAYIFIPLGSTWLLHHWYSRRFIWSLHHSNSSIDTWLLQPRYPSRAYMVVIPLVNLEGLNCCYTTGIHQVSTSLLHNWYSSMVVTPLTLLEGICNCYITRLT